MNYYEERDREYPPPLQGSLKPLKKIMLLPNLFRTLSIFCISISLVLNYVSMFTNYIKEIFGGQIQIK